MNFESCPGELKCETKEGNRIYGFLKQFPDREIELICGDCRFRDTKPGNEPPHLIQAIHLANELEEESMVYGEGGMGATLDSLDIFEYACLLSIKAARRASENKSMKDPQQKPEPPKVDVGHLQRLAHGRK